MALLSPLTLASVAALVAAALTLEWRQSGAGLSALRPLAWGLSLCLALAVAAVLSSRLAPALGTTTISILFGVAAGNALNRWDFWKGGAGFAERRLLPMAIAMLGVQLDLRTLAAVGLPAGALIGASVLFTVVVGYYLGRRLGLPDKCALLLGVGNGICGSSAIASVGRVVDASEQDLGLTIAAVNLMGTLGLLCWPLLARALELSPMEAAGFLGGSLQAVGHVVAAGYGMSERIGTLAVAMKMGRVLLLGPVAVICGWLFAPASSASSAGGDEEGARRGSPLPLFIVVFFVASLAVTFLPVPPALRLAVERAGKLLLNAAMLGVGMKILFAAMISQGPQVMLVQALVGSLQVGAVLLLAMGLL